jgi:cysteine desulfuration protein SufE
MTDFNEIFDTFELLGDWDARYQYLVELGEALQPLPPQDRIDANRVKACMSTVHVAARRDPAAPRLIRFRGDCDTAIIKGVVALLVQVMSGKTAGEIQALDIDRLFAGLHLQDHLSPARHVGIYAIVEQMKQQAARLLEAA